jgi:CheY-like chemotaxis protein
MTVTKSKAGNSNKYSKVLLVDEDQIDNFINERMITSTNFSEEVVVQASAPAALSWLKKTLEKKEELPKIIFLDLNMPVMDGFGFLAEYDKLVKDYPNLKTDVKIIVLSSSISPIDIDRASTNPHVFKYLNKPLSEKYLLAINL